MVPEPGDRIEREGIQFTVEACDGKRASRLRVAVLAPGLLRDAADAERDEEAD